MDTYEKKYKEALEKIRKGIQPLQDGSKVSGVTKGFLEEIFPELRESEDEKIRKEIVRFIQMEVEDEIVGNKWLAWLEKQGEQKVSYSTLVETGNGCDDEQNYSDKIEPKFKVGDWVIFYEHHNSIYQIEKIENYRYILRHYLGGSMSVHFDNELIRPWTLADARDGDVLVDKSDGTIGIFQSIGHQDDGGSYNDPSYCFLHCRYDDGFFYADFENGNTMESDDAIPATKEHRDFLFAKMKEVGYEWDAEMKNLKKIEQSKLTEFEDAIKDMMDDYRDAIDENDATVEEVKERAAYLLSLIPYKPTEWSEEDEDILNEVIRHFDRIPLKHPTHEVIGWLVSIKHRIGG